MYAYFKYIMRVVYSGGVCRWTSPMSQSKRLILQTSWRTMQPEATLAVVAVWAVRRWAVPPQVFREQYLFPPEVVHGRL